MKEEELNNRESVGYRVKELAEIFALEAGVPIDVTEEVIMKFFETMITRMEMGQKIIIGDHELTFIPNENYKKRIQSN